MTEQWKKLAESHSLVEMQDLAAYLRNHGIRATIPDQLGASTGMTDVWGLAKPHAVMVPEEDFNRAEAAMTGIPPEREPRRGRGAEEPAWPTCPRCGKPRQAVCPFCGTAGHDFALPDELDPDDINWDDQSCGDESCGCGARLVDDTGDRVDPIQAADEEAALAGDDPSTPELVICPTCDEPFRPRLADRCPWCDYKFPDGVPVPPQHILKLPPEVSGQFNARVWGTIAVLVVAVAGLMAFFASVLSH